MPRLQIPDLLRQQVIERSLAFCEYCQIHQDDTPETHQLDHFIAVKHGGETVIANLVLACARCNRFKGSDLAGIDPADGAPAFLFKPRLQAWQDHFRLDGEAVVGITPSGRATVALLRMNDDSALAQRRQLMRKKRYPPPRG